MAILRDEIGNAVGHTEVYDPTNVVWDKKLGKWVIVVLPIPM